MSREKETQLQRATKRAREKPEENYMLISFGYDKKYVLPYKDGAAVMEALVRAEQLYDEYSEKNKRIGPIEKDKITASPLSAAHYHDWKIAGLLGIKPEEQTKAREETERAEFQLPSPDAPEYQS